MSDQKPNPEQVAEALFAHAALGMKNGASDEEIIRELKEKGLTEELARSIVSKIRPVDISAKSKTGSKNMIFGAIQFFKGLGFILPYQTIETEYDGTQEAKSDVPFLLVNCSFIPNGYVYEDNHVGSDDEPVYKYFAGLDVQFSLSFNLPGSGRGYSCELTVAPPDQFSTSSSSNLSKSKYMASMIYQTRITEAYKNLPAEFLESVCNRELDDEMRNKLLFSEIGGFSEELGKRLRDD